MGKTKNKVRVLILFLASFFILANSALAQGEDIENFISPDVRPSDPVTEIVKRGAKVVLGSLASLGLSIIAAVVAGLAYVAYKFGSLALLALGWALYQTINIPILRDAAGQPTWALEVGWRFTRDLVNMVFIIILAWIGIATILRLSEYRTGRVFLNLILIALLVNFSPVLVGLVIDVSNIIAGFFINGILNNPQSTNVLDSLCVGDNDPTTEERGIWCAMGAEIATILSKAANITPDLTDNLEGIFALVAYGGFFVIATFVFGLLALLFIFRVIAFWILLVLAPIAFVAFILPATRWIWNMWWHQLLQWAFIGVIAAFFIFLSFQLLEASTSTQLTQAFECGTPTGESICDVVAQRSGGDRDNPSAIAIFAERVSRFVIALAFMIAGLFYGFSTSAMGATTIMRFTQKRALPATLRFAGRSAAWVPRKVISHPRAKARIQQAALTTPTLRESFAQAKGVGGKIKAVALSPFRFAKRETAQLLLRGEEFERRRFERLGKELAERKTESQILNTLRFGKVSQASALAQSLAQKGELKDYTQRLRELGMEEKTLNQRMKELIKYAAGISPDLAKEMVKSQVHLADELAKELPRDLAKSIGLSFKDEEERRKYEDSLVAKLLDKMGTKDIPKIDIEGLKQLLERGFASPAGSKELLQAQKIREQINLWDNAKFSKAAEEFGEDFVKILEKEKPTLGKILVDYKNLSQATWLASNAAKEAGIPYSTVLSPRQVIGLHRTLELAKKQPEILKKNLENVNKELESLQEKAERQELTEEDYRRQQELEEIREVLRYAIEKQGEEERREEREERGPEEEGPTPTLPSIGPRGRGGSSRGAPSTPSLPPRGRGSAQSPNPQLPPSIPRRGRKIE